MMIQAKAYIYAILVQIIYAATNILCKDVFNGGMPTTVFVFYRLFVGTFVFVPLAFVFGRKNAPNLSRKLTIKIFFLALFGTTFMHNIITIGVKYTSSTVIAATSNAIPVVTFALAVLLRMENVKLRNLSGIIKILGVMLCLAGVLVIAFYEGPTFKTMNHHQPLLPASKNNQGPHSKVEWIIGTFLLILFAASWSIWIILQGPILKEYPSKLLFGTFCTFFGAMQSFFVAWISERDFNKWKLHLDDSLLAVLFTGIVNSGLAVYLQIWCVEKKGPVFMAIWQPLSFLFTLVGSIFFLGEMIKLGSVLGGVLMVGGLYSVLWGKHRDNLEKKSSAEQEINCQLPVSKCATNQDDETSIPDSVK